MDDLTAFIRARLGEDEAAADELHNRIDCDLNRLQSFGECSCGYPARVLREVAAKRALLAAYEDAPEFSDPWIGLDAAVRICAAVWSDHPDYRQEWAPR